MSQEISDVIFLTITYSIHMGVKGSSAVLACKPLKWIVKLAKDYGAFEQGLEQCYYCLRGVYSHDRKPFDNKMVS